MHRNGIVTDDSGESIGRVNVPINQEYTEIRFVHVNMACDSWSFHFAFSSLQYRRFYLLIFFIVVVVVLFFFGRTNAIAAILDFKSRTRLGRQESATKGVLPFPSSLRF